MYKNLQTFPARPVSCMRITRNSESCNVTHALNGILSLGGFMKEMIIFDFLRRTLKKSEGLVECHGECNTSKVLSVEMIRDSSTDRTSVECTLPTFFLKTANKLPSPATGPLGNDVRCVSCWAPAFTIRSLTANERRATSSSSSVSDSSEAFKVLCPSNTGIRSSCAPASEWAGSRMNSSAPSGSSTASNQMLPPSLREVTVDAQVFRAIGLANLAGEWLSSDFSSTVDGSGDPITLGGMLS